MFLRIIKFSFMICCIISYFILDLVLSTLRGFKMSKYYRFIPIYALLVLFCFQGNAVAGNHASLSEIKKELAAIQENMNQKLLSLSLRSRLLAQLALETQEWLPVKTFLKRLKKYPTLTPRSV